MKVFCGEAHRVVRVGYQEARSKLERRDVVEFAAFFLDRYVPVVIRELKG